MSTNQIHIDPYERNWMIISAILLVLFATAVSVAAFGMGIQVPAPEQRVDPGEPWQPTPIAHGRIPGLREIEPGKYDAYVLARAIPSWEYLPKEMTIPAGLQRVLLCDLIGCTARFQDPGYKRQLPGGPWSGFQVDHQV